MLLYTFGTVMCPFIVFLLHTECQASRISLCRHVDDLSMISTMISNDRLVFQFWISIDWIPKEVIHVHVVPLKF